MMMAHRPIPSDCSSHSQAPTADDSTSSTSSNSSSSTAPTTYSARSKFTRGESWHARSAHGRKVSFDDEGRGSMLSVGTTSSQGSDCDACHAHDILPEEPERYWSDALAATPEEFADCFPSTRRLDIRHDESSSDGNMNLRIDTKIALPDGRRQKLTLFHLRMNDLRTRAFSLRRYSRDSGREVCHSSRKQTQPFSRPPIARSLSSILSKSLKSTLDLGPIPAGTLKRKDSGYDSVDGFDDAPSMSKSKATKRINLSDLTDTIAVEFSNYFHLDLKRLGRRNHKHYDFDYWGTSYSWKRVLRDDFGMSTVTYHLVRRHDEMVLAHLAPVIMTDEEAREEEIAGGWISPYTFWLSHADLSSDLGDVLMSTAIFALVDDSIRRRFHSKEHRPLIDPKKLGPLRWLDDALSRRPQTAQ